MAFHDTDEADSTNSERRWVDRTRCLTAPVNQAATRALLIKYLKIAVYSSNNNDLNRKV